MSDAPKPKTRLGLLAHCDSLGVGIWSCPRFIFLVMGVVIIASILTTYHIAQRNTDPEIVIAIVTLLTIFLLVITQILVNAFEKVVASRQMEIARTKEILDLKDQFVYLAVHDLASAATAVKWGLKMVEHDIDTIISHDEQDIFKSIRTRNEQLITLVHEILSITRIERGNIALKTVPTEIPALIEELVELCWTKEGLSPHSYTIEAATTLPVLTTDREQLKNILTTLMNNARKYADHEHPQIKLQITLEGKVVVVRIENNGDGIAPELQKHIFQKFWIEAGSTRIERASFGLYIAQSLAHLLGGSISFTSQKDVTQFVLRIPIISPPPLSQ